MMFEEKVIIGIVTGLILFGITLGYVGVKSYKAERRAEAEFMTECRLDRKEYECVAMWRAGAGTKSHTTVIPMPVIIGR